MIPELYIVSYNPIPNLQLGLAYGMNTLDLDI